MSLLSSSFPFCAEVLIYSCTDCTLPMEIGIWFQLFFPVGICSHHTRKQNRSRGIASLQIKNYTRPSWSFKLLESFSTFLQLARHYVQEATQEGHRDKSKVERFGQIPSNLSHCTNLVHLSVINNKLTGKFPLELGFLSKLELIVISGNHLSGEIPNSIGNLSSLEILAAAYNFFKGQIPESIGQLKSLTALGLGANELSVSNCL
ncbi:hypothetical protein JCGZ_01441 [Jatropha curcas]|uniref:Leucine-rich repeat-containing N-terminal plant-type domain-containing protein n=1 Tax=Jatropha curcas TaxID=180498 RepID=A0A067L907_JATCU|nr:receptor-like protein 35 [Jatropha curcas]KDP44941.1 hypothetical protein JCGZ_01441 [Jatropha curcas]